MATVEITGLNDLQRAVAKSPDTVLKEAKRLINRLLAQATRLIGRPPWEIGQSGSGKGAPVSTGNLRQTHVKTIIGLTGILYPTADYAEYVHGGTKRMKARPWLDQASEDLQPQVEEYSNEFLEKVTSELAN